ncbi:MAG: DsrE/DsrF/DrsH-like family protein [bacterium]
MTQRTHKKKVTIVVFSGDLDRVMAALIIATGAAAAGSEVLMFFTFWGLNVLKKNEGSIPSRGLLRKMMNRMSRGGTSRLPLSRMDMHGIGRRLMKMFMRKAGMATVDELLSIAKSMGVKIVACTTTMGVMGVPDEVLRPEVDTIAGVSTYLGHAEEGNINLFI